jgi:hypothetical protein
MLLRIWIWLTQSTDLSYARFSATGGMALMVLGVVLFALGRPGNTGLPLAGVGAVGFGVGILTYLGARRQRGYPGRPYRPKRVA